MKKIIRVALGLVIKDQGQFLITLRNDPKSSWAHLKWEIPGGGIEKDETAEQAVIRELKEEIGVTAELLPYPPIQTEMTRNVNSGELLFIFSTFLCRIKSGEVVLDQREAIEYRWVTLEELTRLSFLPGTDEIVGKANQILSRHSVK